MKPLGTSIERFDVAPERARQNLCSETEPEHGHPLLVGPGQEGALRVDHGIGHVVASASFATAAKNRINVREILWKRLFLPDLDHLNGMTEATQGFERKSGRTGLAVLNDQCSHATKLDASRAILKWSVHA